MDYLKTRAPFWKQVEKADGKIWVEAKAADAHFARLREGRPESIETSTVHIDVIRDLKRINGHLTSVAYPILEAAGELADTRLKESQPLMRAPAGS
jgi:phosphate:Na+ symporter